MTQAGLTAQAVADLVGGRLLGDGTVVVRAVRALASAGPEAVSLAVSPRYADELRASRAGLVLVPEALAERPEGRRARVVVRDPYAALVRVIGELFPPEPPAPGVDPTARLGPGCVLGRGRERRARSSCWAGASSWGTAAASPRACHWATG